jgi:hypothetical protein
MKRAEPLLRAEELGRRASRVQTIQVRIAGTRMLPGWDSRTFWCHIKRSKTDPRCPTRSSRLIPSRVGRQVYRALRAIAPCQYTSDLRAVGNREDGRRLFGFATLASYTEKPTGRPLQIDPDLVRRQNPLFAWLP